MFYIIFIKLPVVGGNLIINVFNLKNRKISTKLKALGANQKIPNIRLADLLEIKTKLLYGAPNF